ncbi:MAG TPA: acylphosphatase [Patescibacteria group bacterium]|jgi:acylphosphatase|nr:acylphosphatase [Patescibacteria group bacterium]
MKKHVNITVNGNVQKVGFRFAAIEQALELGLTGLVKNYADGKVQIEVEGEIDQLKMFLRWCHIGPKGAHVEKVDYESLEELQNYETFNAEY